MTTEREIIDWYNKMYLSKGINSMRPYVAYPAFLDYLRPQTGKRLLDIACGTGFFLLAATRRGLKTFGVDISEESVKIAKNISPDSFVSTAKGEDLKFDDNTFDYITCLGALEHFLDMNKGIEEMKRVSKEDAIFCIMVPNSKFIFWKISGNPGTAQQEVNENLLSLSQWKNIFINSRFQILNIYQDRWFMKNIRIFSSLNPLGIISRMIHKLIWIFLPLKYTYQFIFILKKKS